MKRLNRRVISCAVIAVLLLLPTAVALAKGLGALTVTGPGIKGELKLDNERELMKLDEAGFFILGQGVAAPENPGEGYTLTRHLYMEDGLIAWDQFIYYPGSVGKPGYIYLVGPVAKEAERTSKVWYRARSSGEQAFQNLLQTHGVSLPSSAAAPEPAAVQPKPVVVQPAVEQPPVSVPAVVEQPASVPVQPAAPPQDLSWVVGAGALIALAAGFALMRRLFAPRARIVSADK